MSGPLQPGQLLGSFQVEALLGAGAMGVAYRARNLKTGRVVAIKALLPGADPVLRLRFEREGEAMARLVHANLLAVHSVLATPSGPALVIEYADGGSLADRIAGGPLSPVDAKALFLELARGLEAAHAAGVLHRDLKPENVLFGGGGSPKLADFGLARVSEGRSLTQTHELIGTPVYMAPEQARGEPCTSAVDVYALGAVVYHALAGRPPILPGATLIDLLRAIQSERPPPFASLGVEVPADLEAICQRCLSKTPAARPSASELVALLEAAPEPELPDAKALGLVAASLLVAILLGGGVGYALRDPSRPSPAPSAIASASPRPSATLRVAREPQRLSSPLRLQRFLANCDLQDLREMISGAPVSSDVHALYRKAGDANGLPAGVRLAELGHTFGAARTAVHWCSLRPSKPLSKDVRRLLWAAAGAGDDDALHCLGYTNELKHGDAELARMHRFLGLTSRPFVRPSEFEVLLHNDGFLAQSRPKPDAAWRKVLQARLEVADPKWRAARRALSDKEGAVAAYVALLDSTDDPTRREELALELSRAAELAWLPRLGPDRRLLELYPPPGAVTSPGPLTLDEVLDVLERVRWERGLLIACELEAQFADWHPGAPPPPQITAWIDEALELRPGSVLAHFARYQTWVAEPERLRELAVHLHAIARRDQDRERIHVLTSAAILTAALRGGDLPALHAAHTCLPGFVVVETRFDRVRLEHLMLRQGSRSRQKAAEARRRFRLFLQSSKAISERQRDEFRRRLEELEQSLPLEK